MSHVRAVSALLLPLLCFSGGARGQEQLTVFAEEASGPVEIHARELTAAQAADSAAVEARGAVTLTWKGYRLTADRASYDHRTGIATADGSVRLEDAEGNVLECRELQLNVVTQEGTIRDGRLLIAREGYRVWGRHFHKTGANTYQVEDGGYTACDGSWPSWRVEARRIDVELEGYLKSRGASFWVEGVPLAYTPYLLFPVKRQRQAGFLVPKAGVSTRDGAVLVLRYFWPFADSADLLARLEYRSRRGWTKVGEFRYVLAEGHQGTLEASHLSDRRDGAEKYTVKADHDSRFDETTRMRLHVDYLGDPGYLRDVGDTIDDRGKDRLESYLLGTRDLEQGTAFAWGDFFQALNQDQGEVLQTLPAVGLDAREAPLWRGLAWAPSARLTNFYRAEGTHGQRLELDPGFAWDARGAGLGLGFRVGYREQGYRVDGEWTQHGAPRAEVASTSTLVRTWGAFVHTVEPTVRFAWEDRGQGDAPPAFDARDAFETGSDLSFVLESRLLRTSDLTEVASLDLERVLDTGQGWGPWNLAATARPRERLSLRAEGAFDPEHDGHLLLASVTGEDADARGDRLFAGYHFLQDRARYLDAGAELALTGALSLQYRRRHSFQDHETLEEGLSLHLSHMCWEVLASFSRNYRAEEDRFERRYFVTLQLKGLGKLGSLRGVMP